MMFSFQILFYLTESCNDIFPLAYVCLICNLPSFYFHFVYTFVLCVSYIGRPCKFLLQMPNLRGSYEAGWVRGERSGEARLPAHVTGSPSPSGVGCGVTHQVKKLFPNSAPIHEHYVHLLSKGFHLSSWIPTTWFWARCNISLELQNEISDYTLTTSTWISHRHLEFAMSITCLRIPTNTLSLLMVFPFYQMLSQKLGR